MSRYKEKHIRKDGWVKDLLRTYNPEALATLIEKRIIQPHSNGPYVQSGETPIDIINAYIGDDGPADFREKIEPAIGLLLYKMLHGEKEVSHTVLRGIFDCIRESKLANCYTLLQSWLNQNASWLISENDKEQNTMRDALMAFAKIQKKDAATEHYWFNIWREGKACYHPAAFHGLRQQNPKAAIAELPLLASRKLAQKLDKAQFLISGMWHDENSKHQLERAIKRGIDDNSGWAGLVLNMLLDKLNETQKSELMERLK
jgi:hypothetical protein